MNVGASKIDIDDADVVERIFRHLKV
ncbi:uncharacterized protein METZ01_LOCUS180605 [marine metagenome]|uniref:Uncharacterized protein n=1 Tax=marine metagenome TaxID=408172 RepID=A0A382CQ49_9ZZZZ